MKGVRARAGFTLIEVLVVVAIIGLLASVILASLNSARQRGRDARRLEDMNSLEKAFTLYEDSNGGLFPVSAATTTLTGTDTVSTALIGSGAIAQIPLDPLPEQSYTYQTDASGTVYTLNFCLEATTQGTYAPGCNNYVSATQ